MLRGEATEATDIELTRRRAADLGTRQVYPHSAQVLAYSFADQGNRT